MIPSLFDLQVPPVDQSLNVRRIRNRLQISQAQLGALVGAHLQTVSRWELGQLEPHPFQSALLRAFAQSRPPLIGADIGSVLASEGVVAALRILLNV